jgi:hypothetical protein
MVAEISREAPTREPVCNLRIIPKLTRDMARRVELINAQSHELGKHSAIAVR